MRNALILFFTLASVSFSSMASINTSKLNPSKLQTASVSNYVMDLSTGKTLYHKNANVKMPIASLTKLMTAMVALDAKIPLSRKITFTKKDKAHMYNTYTRIRMGSTLSRGETIRIALMSSENLAAAALATNYPGGHAAFIRAMNRKAKALGMHNTHFVDSSGLDARNRSTASDVAKMVRAAHRYQTIRKYSTTPVHTASFGIPHYKLAYTNTNALVRGKKWAMNVSKTGFLNAAGRCLGMVTTISGKKILMVMLDSQGKMTPVGDAGRIKDWLLTGKSKPISADAKYYQRMKLKKLTGR